MRQIFILILFLFSLAGYAGKEHRGKDSTNIYEKIDTNYIVNFRDLLTAKLFAVVRTNKFTIQDRASVSSIEYTINTRLNMGFSLNFKGVGFDIEWSPPGLNNDDLKYGKSSQFAVSTSANGRCLMYDVYYRQYQGFRTTGAYRTANDTTFDYSRRSDIKNYHAGFSVTYIFNNKRFSSGAVYSSSKKQRKSMGSLLLGTYAFLYNLSADSIIYPDTVYRRFRKELQFVSATSVTYGLSCGYTYTVVFGKKKNWFVNLTTIPGLSYQELYTVNAFDKSNYKKTSLALSLQSRFALGYNRRNYFIGIYWMNNNFVIGDDNQASIQYKYGTFKFYYGHRFDLRRVLKKKL
jgi:hypothetical protein